MTINIGTPERWIRLILGLVLLALAFFGGVSTLWAWIWGLVGAVLIATGTLRFCPAWALFGINTNRGKK